MKKFITIAVVFLLLVSCSGPKTKADSILFNGKIYTVDSAFSIQEALVIENGKIIYCGNSETALDKYEAGSIINLEQKVVFPGFIDAHCHFYGYGKGLNELNFVNSKSYQEIIQLLISYAKENNLFPENSAIKLNEANWIIGRGWDQNDWGNKEFPDKTKLDSLFPNTPVLLKRIDGHAILVNQKALNIAGFSEQTKINGGELIIKNGKLSGILIDNAGDSLEKFIPKSAKEIVIKALLRAQDSCIKVGLTTIDDAGLEKNIIDAIDELQQSHKLKIKIYAMLSPTPENIHYYLKNGVYKTERLNICSFKFYADGALGSRGACLKKVYNDKKDWQGFLLNDISYFKKFAEMLAPTKFQMNTHCIGDSAGKIILDIYSMYCKSSNKRWRIEHAQIIDETEFKKFNKDIIPSVQPTHATSDMYWAENRIGKERMAGAYAYKKLLQSAGIIALGTDFPVEHISPFKTFYAAVVRKDAQNYPKNGFQTVDALTRVETLKGMTIWAAYSNFEEKEKGSLEVGKFADFIILDQDLMLCKEKEIMNTKVLNTFINGEEVYSVKGTQKKSNP
ncbi:MAG: amidohydrolase [Sphingobacteriaceae bacterium]|nr:amidohydrolase [Sphingobacteriaceae bacterium]